MVRTRPIRYGQNISPKELVSCRVVIIRGVMVIPISAGSVIAAGKEEATPRPTTIALDHSSACDGMNMHKQPTTQQMVLANMAGHADVT